MSSQTGFEAWDRSYLLIQVRLTGLFPGDWRLIQNLGSGANTEAALVRLEEYRDHKRHTSWFRDDSLPVEYRLVRVTVRQTVTEEILDEGGART